MIFSAELLDLGDLQFQDVVGQEGFYLFGHHIANADQTQLALAVSSLPNQIIGFIITLPAGWISDRFANERCLICCVAAVITTIFPLINAFYPSYTAIICASIAGSVIGGLTGPCGGALRADIVPVDPATGVSKDPARDYLILNYAAELPRLIIPIIMAIVFMLFQNDKQAYFVFFLISAAIHFASALLLLKVRSEMKRVERGELHTDGTLTALGESLLSAKNKTGTEPAWGAGLCDRLLFGPGRGRLESRTAWSSRPSDALLTTAA